MLMLLQIDPAMGSEVLSTVSASAIAVAVIQYLKNAKWVPFMDQHSAGVNRLVAWAAAFASSVGLHYTFDHQTGTLTITGLTLAVIGHTAWDTAKSYAMQWMTYNLAIKQPAATVSAIAGGMPVVAVASPGAVQAGVEKAQAVVEEKKG